MIFYNSGVYKVEDTLFTNKLSAAIYATTKKKDIKWEFHDDVFRNTLRHYFLGSQNLPDLYKQRAQQLRDSYDYLVLHYSGGADSWNILNTFLKNNIKLDYVFVKWPIKAMDKNLYIPNTQDTSAMNFASEWDYVLKKDLNWLNQNHPEIKIEIFDWLDNLKEVFLNDDLFQNINMHNYRLLTLLQFFDGSNIERVLIDKGKKVASIFGVDKPMLIEKNNCCFFYFTDQPLLAINKLQQTNETTEYFYWTPDLPILAIEQANKVFQYYRNNPQDRHKILSYSSIPDIKNWKIKDFYSKFQSKSDIAKMVIYPNWDSSRFQAEKPVPYSDLLVSQRYIWLEKLPILAKYREVWYHYFTSYLNKIDRRFKLLDTEDLKPIHSDWHFLGKF